jgi:hypothetical protein
MKKILLLPLLYFVTAGCKKEELYQVSLKSTELRRANNIKQGSYYIYKNTLNGTIDSFWVYYFNNKYNATPHSKTAYESISYGIQDASNNTLLFDYSTQFKYKNCETISLSINKEWFLIPVLMIPFNENTESISTDSDSSKTGLQMRNAYPSLIINGHPYADVYEVYAFKTQLVDNIQDTVLLIHSFISLETGLVKFTYHKKNSSSIMAQGTWEIESSKIVR